MANEEKKEFLRREEIRTMRKDIELAREEEAKRGRERISGLKITEEVKKKPEKPSFVVVQPKPEQKPGFKPVAEAVDVGKEVLEGEKEKAREKEKVSTWNQDQERKRLAEEAERKWEEEQERVQRERERIILAKKDEKEKLKEESTDIKKLLKGLPLRRKPLQDRIREFSDKKEQLQKDLTPILDEEKEIEEKKSKIEEKEKKAISPEKKREAEQERWKIEEERKKIEAQKWKVGEKIEEVEKKIKKIELKFQKILKDEEELTKRKEEISAREKEIALEDEKEELGKEITELIKERQPLDRKIAEFSEKKRALDESLNKILKEEREIEGQIRSLEEKERSAPSLKEQREIEKKRWEMEKDRIEVEEERWKLENEKKEINIQTKEINLNRQRLLGKENRLKVRVKEIEKALQKGRKEEEPLVEEEKPSVAASDAAIEDKKDKERPIEKEEAQVKKEEPEVELIRKARERLERLRREEGKGFGEKKTIEQEHPDEEFRPKGFGRDIRRDFTAEEQDRKAEKERLERARLALEEQGPSSAKAMEGKEKAEEARKIFPERAFYKEKKEFPLQKPPQAPFSLEREGVPSVPLSPIPQRPSPFKKIAVRIAVILILVLFLAFTLFIWPGFLKRGAPTSEQVLPPSEVLPPVAPPEIPPAVEVPISLIEVAATETLEISEISDIPSFFGQVFQKELPEGAFTRILFKNTKENQFVEFPEFLTTFQVKVPEDFYQNITKDYTLFIFAQPEGKRFGFVVRTEEVEQLNAVLKSWEETMEKDFESLLLVLGKEKPVTFPAFKSANRAGINFHYLTFIDKEGFGICYLVSGEYFIWSSSCQGLITLIEKLF